MKRVKQFIIVLTEKHKLLVFKIGNELECVMTGDLSMKYGQLDELRSFALDDYVCCVYKGLAKVVEFNQTVNIRTVRIEAGLRSVCRTNDALWTLYEGFDKSVNVKSVLKEPEVEVVVDKTSSMLIPWEKSLIVVALDTIQLIQAGKIVNRLKIPLKERVAYVESNGGFIIGADGELELLKLPEFQLTHVAYLDCAPKTMFLLEPEKLFIGCHFGNTQIFDLSTSEKQFELANISPVTDLLVQDRGVLVSNKNLQLIKNGIGISVEAEIELSVDFLFVLDGAFLLLSFESSSELIALDGLETIEWCLSDSKVLLARVLESGEWLVVVEDGVILLKDRQVSRKIELEDKVLHTSSFENRLLFVYQNKVVMVDVLSLDIVVSKQIDDEVSCLLLTQDQVFLGLWKRNAVEVYDHTFQLVNRMELDEIPRSLGWLHGELIIALGNGAVQSITGKILLSCNKPASLQQITWEGEQYVVSKSEELHLIKFNKRLQPVLVNQLENTLSVAVLKDQLIVHDEAQIRFVKFEQMNRFVQTKFQHSNFIKRVIRVNDRDYLIDYESQLITCVGYSEFRLEKGERALCITSFLGRFIVVGTGFDNEAQEVTKGRLLLLNNDLTLVQQLTLRGGVFACVQLNEMQAIAISCNTMIYVYSLNSKNELYNEISAKMGTMILQLKCKDDLLLAGDLIKPPLLLRLEYDQTYHFTKQYMQGCWTTAVEFAVESIVSFDTKRNMNIFGQDSSSLGSFYTGEIVNVAKSTSNGLVFASVDGLVGRLSLLSQDKFQLFKSLEKAMNMPGIGALKHRAFRYGSNESAIVDGDYISSFLDLDKPTQLQIYESLETNMEASIDDMIDAIERIIEVG